jgi:hypothetical protein
MKKFALMMVLGVAGFAFTAGNAKADWGTCHYGGYQPKWAFWARHCKPGCCSEEERWQRFWHDYYDALQHYYDRLDNIDWVTYYKFHGYQINGGGAYGCCGRPTYAPVFVSPTIQWAVPSCPMPGPAPAGYQPH